MLNKILAFILSQDQTQNYKKIIKLTVIKKYLNFFLKKKFLIFIKNFRVIRFELIAFAPKANILPIKLYSEILLIKLDRI